MYVLSRSGLDGWSSLVMETCRCPSPTLPSSCTGYPPEEEATGHRIVLRVAQGAGTINAEAPEQGQEFI